MSILVLSQQEIQELVLLDQEVVSVIEEGFGLLTSGRVTTPPILRLEVDEHNGEADVKTAYVHGLNSFAIKVSTGFFNNPKRGLPSGSGLMLLFATDNGFPIAVLLENGYLTHVRTAAAGAVAAKHLAPLSVNTVGIVGSGAQARWQLRALSLVRQFSRVLVYGHRLEAAVQYAREMAKELGVTVYPAKTVEEVVRESQVVITTTPAQTPLIKGEWLHSGLHITAMGSDAEDKRELSGNVLAQADRVVCDLTVQSLRLGELHHAIAEGAFEVNDPRIMELGEIVLGRRAGRQSEAEITVCDLTGTGVQDTLIARLTYQRARARGLGLKV